MQNLKFYCNNPINHHQLAIVNIKELKKFVFDFRRVSLAEMKLYLGIDRDTLNPMLERLIQQGVVQKSYTAEECTTCQKCDLEEVEFYEWIEQV